MFDDLQDLRRIIPGLEPGKSFPNLTLPAVNGGQPMSVADFRGQKVLLHVWASW